MGVETSLIVGRDCVTSIGEKNFSRKKDRCD